MPWVTHATPRDGSNATPLMPLSCGPGVSVTVAAGVAAGSAGRSRFARSAGTASSPARMRTSAGVSARSYRPISSTA